MNPQRSLITSGVTSFILFILVTCNVYSQGNSNGNANSNNNANGNALKWETQGNNADTSHFIGTTNPIALKMRTNNVERLRITKDGKFGIGISNPLEKFELQGNLKLTGDIIFSDYADLTDTTEKFVFVDKDGRTDVKTKAQLKSLMYEIDCYAYTDEDISPLKSSRDILGVTLPTWANRADGTKNILYTGTGCPAWVGIGTDNPLTILDIHGDVRADEGIALGDLSVPQAGIHIRNYAQNNGKSFDKLLLIENNSGRKLLQLNNKGLLRAREIKVDEDVWADYVFQPGYKLLPLNKVKEFIAQNGHLPNIPSAEEIEKDGVNLGETAKLTMEKVEELTLYVIDQQEQIDEQQGQINKLQKLLEEQRKLLEIQRELLKQQQNQIKELK